MKKFLPLALLLPFVVNAGLEISPVGGSGEASDPTALNDVITGAAEGGIYYGGSGGTLAQDDDLEWDPITKTISGPSFITGDGSQLTIERLQGNGDMIISSLGGANRVDFPAIGVQSSGGSSILAGFGFATAATKSVGLKLLGTSNLSLLVGTGPTEFFSFTTTGFGVNTTAPTEELHVSSGTIRTDGTGAGIEFGEGADTLTLSAPTLTADRAVTFPDQAGEVLLNTGSGATVYGSTQTSLSIVTDSGGTPSTTTVTDSASGNIWTGVLLDAEGTGNTLTTVEKIWLPSAGCNNATASTMMDLPTSNAPAPGCRTGSNIQKGVLDFDASTDEAAYSNISLPADWTGAVDARFFWEANDTGTNSAIWTIATICLADGETDDPAFNTASSVTDANGGTTAHKVMIASVTGITTTGCAAGELMNLKVTRDADNGSDNLAVDARLIGVELTLRRAQ